jgi:small subunit ribosomal protein S26e
MGKKVRGRERLINCDSCGRRIPRDKSVSYLRTTVISTELRTADDMRMLLPREMHYCISCGKHKGIFEKKKRQQERLRERRKFGGGYSGGGGGYGSGGQGGGSGYGGGQGYRSMAQDEKKDEKKKVAAEEKTEEKKDEGAGSKDAGSS